MAEFLTPEWAEVLSAALRGNDAFTAASLNAELTLQYVVSDAPAGEVAWYLKLDRGASEVGVGRLAAAHVVLACDFATSLAMARGELTMQAAQATGRLSVEGDLGRLFQNQAALATFDVLHEGLVTDG